MNVTVSVNGTALEADSEDLKALMALAVTTIDNRLCFDDDGCTVTINGNDPTNYIRWRKLAKCIADMVK